MSVRLYFDHNVRGAVAAGLRLRGIDVLTAYEDGTHEIEDPDLLDRATDLGRVLFTHDDDLITEAVRRQRAAERFAGVIYAHQKRMTIGETVDQLEIVAKATEPEEFGGRVLYLPL